MSEDEATIKMLSAALASLTFCARTTRGSPDPILDRACNHAETALTAVGMFDHLPTLYNLVRKSRPDVPETHFGDMAGGE